jgi:hypothetical protein
VTAKLDSAIDAAVRRLFAHRVPSDGTYSPDGDIATEIRRQCPEGVLRVHFAVPDRLYQDGWALMGKFHKRLDNPDITINGVALSRAKTYDVNELTAKQFLNPLMEDGWIVYRDLFSVANLRRRPNQRAMMWWAVQAVLQTPQLVSVGAKDPPFPWAFLYDRAPGAPADKDEPYWKRFWGFHHEIQVLLPVSPTERELWPESRLSVGAAVDTNLDTNVDKNGWHNVAGHPLLSPLLDRADYQTIADLERALKGFNKDCFYFFGHAGMDAENKSPWLALSEEKLPLRRLATAQGQPTLLFNRNLTVVFLNGCSTAAIEKLRDGSALGYLLYVDDRNQNRLCCLGSVGAVPGPTAAEFARRFWESFLAGQCIGTALFRTRVEMMDKCHNPLGLLYALFGDAETRIVRQVQARG